MVRGERAVLSIADSFRFVSNTFALRGEEGYGEKKERCILFIEIPHFYEGFIGPKGTAVFLSRD